MLIKKFQRIRDLTEQIAEFVEALNIEGCQQLIEQRLVLLQEVQLELESTSDNQVKEQFHNLLVWLQKHDDSPYHKACELKAEYQEKVVKQKKTSFAIKQYNAF
ncbi:hypothetical protein J7384_01675 [Endozoicomonas sp. G2_1]|uniref:hypothetical protein n=1 Tax=Endozoicomonas sp. G2_1 TaxID=2821091 RepID=UPI001ADAB139|nr:hypothetical protein [Endozoicomonas sp. G2_1]MBO9489062.1 hypothetical protein [Endozoicomonas sp. G2_1]